MKEGLIISKDEVFNLDWERIMQSGDQKPLVVEAVADLYLVSVLVTLFRHPNGLLPSRRTGQCIRPDRRSQTDRSMYPAGPAESNGPVDISGRTGGV